MKVNNVVLTTQDKFAIISKTEPNYFCVFIQPNGVDVFKVKKAIEELKISCQESSLFVEDLLLETFEGKEEAEKRVLDFQGEWTEQFYVCCYKNGEFLSENGQLEEE